MSGGGLAFDAAEAVAHLRAADDGLAAVIDAAGPYDVDPDPDTDLFASVARSIVFQQLAGAAARTIHDRLRALLGGEVTAAAIAAAGDEELRGCGLSGAKLAALRDLAAHEQADHLPGFADARAMPESELRAALTAVRGVGPWTVDMLCIFRLGLPDVLPVGDLGVREGARIVRGLAERPTPGELAGIAEPWAPYRSVASWYCWRAVDLERAGQGPTQPR